jgi:hypothetical protein
MFPFLFPYQSPEYLTFPAPAPAPISLTLTLPPPSLSVTLPACGVGDGHPSPDPPPPQTLVSRPRSLGMGDENCVWVCVEWGGGGLEVKPRPFQMAVYTETQSRGVS